MIQNCNLRRNRRISDSYADSTLRNDFFQIELNGEHHPVNNSEPLTLLGDIIVSRDHWVLYENFREWDSSNVSLSAVSIISWSFTSDATKSVGIPELFR